MRFAKEKIHELKEKVRFELTKDPNISIFALQAVLRDTYKHNFDKNFIAKLKRKVHRERALRLNFASLNYDIALFEELIRYGRQFLVDIVFNEQGKYTPMQVIAAFREIIRAEGILIEMKLNCGIYQKAKQNQVKEEPLTKEQNDLMKRALNFMYGQAGQSRMEISENNVIEFV